MNKMLKGIKQHYQIYLLLLPVIIYVFIYNYTPMYGIIIAFKDYNVYDGIWGSPNVGFKYFTKFFESYWFDRIMWNTIILSVMNLVLSFPLPIILALALNQLRQKKFSDFAQTVLYAPNFITVVVLVGMMSVFLSPQYGIVNSIIEKFGGEAINFMGEEKWFRWLYVFSGIWQTTGFSAIIYIGALSSVSPELYEAAKMDGANKYQLIRHIDLPCISSTIIIMFILAVGNIMNLGFEKAFLMQNDINSSVSTIIPTYVYNIGLEKAEFSYATAIGLFNTLINAALLITANKISKKFSEVSIW